MIFDDKSKRNPTFKLAKTISSLLGLCLVGCLLLATTGCNQNRYQPTEWRRVGNTLPETDANTEWSNNSAWSGSTLPGRGSTLPGRWMGSTLPGRGSTLPGRGSTLPGRGTTLPPVWYNAGRGSTLPGRGTTLPARGTTLPGRNW